ncbi:acyl-CoA dehydrogenase family protein [Halorarum halobium]|uniref:acyl-CoA dehydrogenase family protein n=1 Tax=Halorarum halobium TaxID=3075121 RepID=UPI0028AFDCBF|nr:acyl-CoA dehydrogenase family protein [Halobaculum sp. XH14]
MDPIDYAQLEDGSHCNYWALDPTLRRAAERAYPDDEFDWAESRLSAFGSVVGHTVADNADAVDERGIDLHTYDRNGDLANDVRYPRELLESERLAYEHGTVADAFRAPADREEPVGLVHTLTMQALLSHADAGLTCPVSMTAGAALVLGNHDDGHLDGYLDGLTAREGDERIEGAMFLTEKQGGSDVGAAETVAERVEGREYELTGEKWFCSNVDAQGTLVLARRPDAPEGTAGLSLFLVPHELPDGRLNDQTYRRLKDKLGTISVPTGEVELQGATGYLVGEPEEGFRYMTTMLNWERVTNATGAVGIIGRGLLEAKVHAANREAFGKRLDELPLMRRDLAALSVEYEAVVAVTMEAARWLDRYERDRGDEEAFKLMRVLAPLSKHHTARAAVDCSSDAMEILGGDGYVREFVTHRLLRDAQVLPIWEGTSNVLSLDLLRAFDRADAAPTFLTFCRERLDEATHPALAAAVEEAETRHEALQSALFSLADADEADAQHGAKELSRLCYDVLAASLLLAGAQAEIDERGDARLAAVARWFVRDRFESPADRGVSDSEAVSREAFDAIVRHAGLDPESLTDGGEDGDGGDD